MGPLAGRPPVGAGIRHLPAPATPSPRLIPNEQAPGCADDLVTAGMYLVPERVRTLRAPAGLGRLREFLAWLARSGAPVYGEVIERVVDVDRAEDVALAETLALAGRVS